MAAFEIPLLNTPQQITVTLAGAIYTLTVKWCSAAACWILDIGDANNVPVLQGVPLVTGADLLEQYAYLGIGGQLIVQSSPDPNAVPTFDNLGIAGHLYFVT